MAKKVQLRLDKLAFGQVSVQTKLDQLNKAKEKQALSRQSPRQATSKRGMKPYF